MDPERFDAFARTRHHSQPPGSADRHPGRHRSRPACIGPGAGRQTRQETPAEAAPRARIALHRLRGPTADPRRGPQGLRPERTRPLRRRPALGGSGRGLSAKRRSDRRGASLGRPGRGRRPRGELHRRQPRPRRHPGLAQRRRDLLPDHHAGRRSLLRELPARQRGNVSGAQRALQHLRRHPVLPLRTAGKNELRQRHGSSHGLPVAVPQRCRLPEPCQLDQRLLCE